MKEAPEGGQTDRQAVSPRDRRTSGEGEESGGFTTVTSAAAEALTPTTTTQGEANGTYACTTLIKE